MFIHILSALGYKTAPCTIHSYNFPLPSKGKGATHTHTHTHYHVAWALHCLTLPYLSGREHRQVYRKHLSDATYVEGTSFRDVGCLY